MLLLLVLLLVLVVELQEAACRICCVQVLLVG